MCNIAGYVGTRDAAPILIAMMRRQEGWDSGYYTGMATICNGRFHMDKIVGNLDMFLSGRTAGDFPGTIGVIHSRTPGGAGTAIDSWSHPFTGTSGHLQLVVNGCGGNFKENRLPIAENAYMRLKAEGYRFGSAVPGANIPRKTMPDGMCVHPTEVMCQLIDSYMQEGMDAPDACAKAYTLRPSEIVGLALDDREPDCISWVRLNYPMYAGIADHGIYLASTPQAMPEDARNITLLSPLSSGRVYRDRVETKPFRDCDLTVSPITPGVWKACYEAMERRLTEEETHHDQLDRLIRPLFAPATCPPESAVDYAIMAEFEKQGRLRVFKNQVPGTAPNSTAPRVTARLK